MREKFDKIQHSFIIATLNKLGVEGNFFSLVKGIYKKSRTNIKLKGERLKAFPPNIRTRQIYSYHFYSTLY